MSSLNRASLEVLILLKLRKRLTHAEQIMLEQEIKQNSDLAMVEQSMTQGLSYIQSLSHIKIIETELPSYPQGAQWTEQLMVWFNFSKRWVLPVILLFGLFGLKFYLDQAGYTRETDTLAQQPMSSHRVVTLAAGVLPSASSEPDKNERGLAQLESSSNSKVANSKDIESVEINKLKQARVINNVVESEVTTSGYVIRAELKTKDLDLVTQSFLIDLNKLSPKKAGEVELGWEKAQNIRYFHFTVGTQHELLIKDLMTKFGKLKWSKDPHPRKMPKETVRFIIQIIESGSE